MDYETISKGDRRVADVGPDTGGSLIISMNFSSSTLEALDRHRELVARLRLYEHLGDTPHSVKGCRADGGPNSDLEPNRHIFHMFLLNERLPAI